MKWTRARSYGGFHHFRLANGVAEQKSHERKAWFGMAGCATGTPVVGSTAALAGVPAGTGGVVSGFAAKYLDTAGTGDDES